jgi:hypothetical protein
MGMTTVAILIVKDGLNVIKPSGNIVALMAEYPDIRPANWIRLASNDIAMF